METKDPVFNKVQRFLKKTAMAPTRFGKEAVGDVNLVAQLDKGRELRRVTRAKVLAYIDGYDK